VLSDWKRIIEPDHGALLDENVNSEAQATAVFAPMSGMDGLLRKKVILAAEHGSLDAGQPRLLAVCMTDCKGNLWPGEVEREPVRRGL
jgi:hypothetical protein